MIKRFHALYVGQIDLDNVGLDGTPANDRRYSSERLAEVFDTLGERGQVIVLTCTPARYDGVKDAQRIELCA